jgi:hypothetical protein
MKQARLIDRREFTAEAVLATLTGVVITLSGCGSGGGYSSPSSPSPSSPPTAAAGDDVGSISNNHGHTAVVTGVQLVAGNAVQLDIRGSADHTHTVTLSTDAIRAIRAGTPVITDSTSTDHQHTVTFNGEAQGDPSRY